MLVAEIDSSGASAVETPDSGCMGEILDSRSEAPLQIGA